MNEVAQHLNHREFFKEGIFYFDLNGIQDIGEIQLLCSKQKLDFLSQKPWKCRSDLTHKYILIIYDNIDCFIKRQQKRFEWHL